MGTRERRLARADRLEGWAEGRRRKATADQATADQMMDAIPFGQPILVGHHSEQRDRKYRDRAWNTMGRAVESARKADDMERRASNIRAAAEHAIYNDDDDAIERLEARIAELEAKRDRDKAANAAYRKAHRDELRAMTPYERSQAVPFPGYHFQNLSGNIKRYRDRLARLQNPRPAAPRPNRYEGSCRHCDETVPAGAGLLERIDGEWQVRHTDCETMEER